MDGTMASLPALMFVHLGEELPPWLSCALAQARDFTTCPIYLIAAARALSTAATDPRLDLNVVPLEEIGVSEKQEMFQQTSRLDTSFRDGFWTRTTERFFTVEAVMTRLTLESVFHLENDVMLYADLRSAAPLFETLYSGIAATFDNDNRCVPGLVYFRDVTAVARLTGFILDTLQHLAAQNLHPQQWARINDMVLLGAFRAK